MLGICVVYLITDGDGEAVLDFSLAQIAARTTGPFRLYGCCPRNDRRTLKRVGRHGATLLHASARAENPSQEHAGLLNMLVDRAISDGCEHVATFDMDSWPIADGWDRLYAKALSDRFPVAAIARTEVGHNFPFAAFTILRRDFWRVGESSFTTRQRGPFPAESAACASRPGETGAGILAQLHAEGLGYLRLERSNIWNVHALMAGVYDNTIFHIGAGSRAPRFLTDDAEYGLDGSPVRRGYADQVNEAKRAFTMQNALRHHEAFLVELAGPERSPLAPIETVARGLPKTLAPTQAADRETWRNRDGAQIDARG